MTYPQIMVTLGLLVLVVLLIRGKQSHRPVVRTVRLALGPLGGLGCRPGPLGLHQRPNLS